MKNLNILIKASLKTHRIFSVFYFMFIFLSSTLILLSISVIFPLKSSIDSEITNHISNRELVYHSTEIETSDENLSFIYPQITILKQIYLQYDLENEQLKEIIKDITIKRVLNLNLFINNIGKVNIADV